MKTVLVLTAAAIAAAAQPPKSAPAPASPATQMAGKAAPSMPVYRPAPAVSRQTFAELERSIDTKIERLDPAELFDILGDTRGVYLDGYGAVFTVELSLIKNPGGPFFRPNPAATEQTHKKKVAHLPVLRKALQDTVTSLANSLVTLPPGQKIVLSARLMYQSWEDTSGLPGEIFLSADRTSALAGNIQVEER